MKILKELFNGNINPHERPIGKKDIRSKTLNELMEIHEALYKKLSDEERTLFDSFMDCNSRFSDITEYELFELGFKIGAKIMLEIFEKDTEYST